MGIMEKKKETTPMGQGIEYMGYMGIFLQYTRSHTFIYLRGTISMCVVGMAIDAVSGATRSWHLDPREDLESRSPNLTR